ncbi:MAG: radical SAM protein [Pseudomonadota bacterium]
MTTLLQTVAPPTKFVDLEVTAKGEKRASVDWRGLKTLWLNTGTLCNIQCVNCYIESSPRNSALVFLKLADVLPYLDEVDDMAAGPIEIGITGGEPFLAPEIIDILDACLSRGHDLLILTNAMRPMMRPRVQKGLLALHAQHPGRMTLRVSLDHYTQALHDKERGVKAFGEAIKGLQWLSENRFKLAIAGRQDLSEDEPTARAGYGALVRRERLNIDPADTRQLVLFPEMVPNDDPPEITTECWGILDVDPASIMCADQRMVIRRKGAEHASITACTLLTQSADFELGRTLKEATAEPVSLNHRWCATFCVLGGASCSA